MGNFIAFDLDGTIVYTLEDIIDGVNYGLTKNGFDPRPRDRMKELIGYSVGYMCTNALPENAREKYAEKVLADYTEYYNKHCCDQAVVYPGVIETLTKLKSMGTEIAVVSNKPNRESRKVIANLFPEGMFSFVIGAMKTMKRKPEPDMLLFTMDYLGVDKNKALYVGDSEVDIKFAANAGIPCISCDWGYRDIEEIEKAGATTIIHSFPELLNHI